MTVNNVIKYRHIKKNYNILRTFYSFINLIIKNINCKMKIYDYTILWYRYIEFIIVWITMIRKNWIWK